MTEELARARGTGTIERVGDWFRPRMPGRGKRLQRCKTYEEAERLLAAVLQTIHDGDAATSEGLTVDAWGLSVLDRREAEGRAASATDRSRWKARVSNTALGRMLLRDVTKGAIILWRDGLLLSKTKPGHGHKKKRARAISRSTAQNTLNLVRVVLGDAADRELIAANPAADVKLPPAVSEAEEPWTYLDPEEQQRLLRACETWRPENARKDSTLGPEMATLIAFALYTGIREGEQWNLRLADVDLKRGRITVRRGSRARGTKGKRIRYVPLLPSASATIEPWLEVLASRPNPLRLVFPTPAGERRSQGKPPRGWESLLKHAGLAAEGRRDGRAVRWHDLRHTCGSALVAGWWGRAWSLIEVRDFLGHASVDTTERYAHLAPSALEAAARATVLVPPTTQAKTQDNDVSVRNDSAPPTRVERVTCDLGRLCRVVELRALECGQRPKMGGIVGRARRALEEIAEGRHALAVELLGEIARGGEEAGGETRTA